MKRILGLSTLTCLISSLAVFAAPQQADACGGTFCDSGPQSMPVDQTGENILFVMDESFVEAHIQIQYDPNTEADQFAWIVPITVLPEFAVSSQALFDNMLAGSVPTYGVTTTRDDCGDPGNQTTAGSATGAPDSSGGTTGGDEGGETDGGPDVVWEETVGAFDVVVLSGGTADEVMQWLGDNGYQQDPNAEPILQEYLQDGFMFAAFKLTNGAQVSEIHPVSLRFPDSDEACVPIRLTRIAAQDDMEIRTFFLADNRVVPRGYRHVLVNALKLDWTNFATNYKEVITLAVDAPEADGKAFVTEYAGPSDVIGQFGLWDAQWDASPFPTIDPINVIDELQSQGILECWGGEFCQFNHALIQGVVAQYLPAPDGVSPEEFYSCLSCYEALIDPLAWDGDEFANAYQDRIIDPGAHALDLLNTWPYLSRMYTTISPGEMTADPFFHQNASLQDVAALQQGQQRILCNGDSVYTLPDGRQVYLPNGRPWPDFQDEMPWEEDVEEVPAQGAAMALVDNTERIDELLAEYNLQHGWPPEGDDGGSDGTGGSGDGGADGGEGGDEGGSGSSGCSCRTSGADAFGVVLFGGLFALWAGGVVRRRRRA